MQAWSINILGGICMMLSLSVACRTRGYNGPKSDHFDGRTFHNQVPSPPKGFFDLLRWQTSGEKKDWPERVANQYAPALAPGPSEDSFAVTFINHASLLIQLPGVNILTDPVWSDRVSPLSSVGPKRVRDPGLAFDALPPIHWVLVSHNHYDHLDIATLKELAAKHHPRILVPLGDKEWLEAEGVSGVEEVDWWQSFPISPSRRVHFTPSQHWSARGVLDRNKSLWGSYFIEWDGKGIYFAGDTGYGPHFKELKAKLPPVRLALLPIGAYEPRWFMKDQHMNPEEAVKAHLDIAAQTSLGIHYGCWQLTDEGIDDPVLDLEKARTAAALGTESFTPADVGRTYLYRWTP